MRRRINLITPNGAGAIAGAIVIIGMLTGCADESPWGDTGSEKGSIELTLTTDCDFDTAKPLFRSGEEETRATVSLGDYTEKVPTAADFKFKLENTKGYSKDWESLDLFNQDKDIKELPTGLYTITAYYGVKGQQGEDRPYFEATSSFTVLPNRPSQVELKAEMKNSMVYIDYTEDFLAYMSSYTTTLSTTGNTQDGISMNARKAVFVEPTDVTIKVDFTTKETNQQASINVGSFPAVAKTLHKMTFDIDHKNNGFATLTITFDETVDNTETINVDLTEQLFATDGPSISYTGSSMGGSPIENGATIDMLGNPEKVEMSVLVPGGLQTATLTVTGTANYSKVVGLHDTDPSALTSEGIKATGFYGKVENTNTLALLDITEYAKNLAAGEYEMKLEVTDKSNRAASFILNLNTETPSLALAKDNNNQPLTSSIEYDGNSTQLVLDYNGSDYQNLTFKASDVDGNMVAASSSYDKSETTRASDMRRCYYNVTLPCSNKSDVKFEAYNHAGKLISTFSVPVAVPEYEVKVDAYSRFAYLKIVPKNASDLTTIMANLKTNIDQEGANITTDATNGKITITGLNKGNIIKDECNKDYKDSYDYTFQSSITNGDNWKNTLVTTEAEKPILNGDFETVNTGAISCGEDNLQVGGKYWISSLNKYINLSYFEYDEPQYWTTINNVTANLNSTYQNKEGDERDLNSWYVVPSSWVETNNESKKGYMRNVGYNHNGPHITGSSGASGSNNYYCKNTPSSSSLNRAAGELNLIEDSFGRPFKITFDYKYNPISSDTGYAYVAIIDKDNKIIASNSLNITSGEKTNQDILLNDYISGTAPYNITIKFRSSNKINGSDAQTAPPINIPTDPQDPGSGSGSPKKIAKNKYKSLATGSELWIDNVTAHYATTPAAAPAPKNTNKKTRR